MVNGTLGHSDDFDDYALRVPGLGFTNLGAAGPRGIGPQINIRGLPDTGYYIGETPIPASNLKLVDIGRVDSIEHRLQGVAVGVDVAENGCAQAGSVPAFSLGPYD